MIPSALLNVKFYLWKTNPRKITRAFSQACTSNEPSGRFIFCPISLPSTLYGTVTIIVPWSLMGEKNNLYHPHILFCVEDVESMISYMVLQITASQPSTQPNLPCIWKHAGEHVCTCWHTHPVAYHLVWVQMCTAVQDPTSFLCSLPYEAPLTSFPI